jgi:hypothetical protein
MRRNEEEIFPPLEEPTPAYAGWDLWRDGVTQSLLERFLLCPQKADWSYRQGIVPSRDMTNLHFGSLFHQRYESYARYRMDRAGDSGSLADWICDECDELDAIQREETGGIIDPESDAQIRALVRVLFRAYALHYHRDWKRMEFVDVEREFAIRYHPKTAFFRKKKPIFVRGKIDAVLKVNDKLCVLDTKTRGRIDESLADRLGHDLQINLYLWAAEQIYGTAARNAIYNLVRRPQLRQKQSESFAEFLNRVESDIQQRPEHYFVRFSATYTRREQATWRSEFDAMLDCLGRWSMGISPSYRNSGACQSGYGVCEYLPFCAGHPGEHRVRDRCFVELETRNVG